MGLNQDFPISLEVQLLGGSPAPDRTTANVCTPGTEIFMKGEMVKAQTGILESATSDDATELQIFDPWGRAVNRFGTIEFHAEFPTDTREFPYCGSLESDQHFAVRLTTPPSATYRPMISYLGSRRERLP